jgi:hypothetical protein
MSSRASVRYLVRPGVVLLSPLLVAAVACEDFGSRVHERVPSRGGAAGAVDEGEAGDDGVSAQGGNGGGSGGPGKPGSSGVGAGGEAGGTGKGSGGAQGGTTGGGAATGGDAGTGAQANQSGGSGDSGRGGDLGDAGSGNAQTDAQPGIYGAVRLLIDDQPVCGGTLIANSWVLTADRCIPWGTETSALSVGFGMSSRNFHQKRSAIEIQRFPGNTKDTRVRDVALIGLDQPFEVDGSTTGHTLSLLQASGQVDLLRTLRCIGWDLELDPESATDELRAVPFSPISVVQRDYGDAYQWQNTLSTGLLQGALPMRSDTGSGCMIELAASVFLAAVHTETPDDSGDLGTSEYQEAYAMITADRELHDWVDAVLFRVLPAADLSLAGAAGVCSFDRASVDLFALLGDGRMGWFQRSEKQGASGDWQSSAEGWIERTALDPPPSVNLASTRPGALCLADGSIELIAQGSDGSLWRQHWSSTEWLPEWELVPDATGVTSGVSVVGRGPGDFHVFARGLGRELRRARFLDGWTGTWDDLGGLIEGAPSARMANPSYIDVFSQGADELWNRYAWGERQGWDRIGYTSSDPAVASWSYDRVDVFVRTPESRLGRHWYDCYWQENAVVGGLVLPDGALAATARENGTFDVFVAQPDGYLWHATWPRNPLP